MCALSHPKVGATTLSRVMRRLDVPTRAEVEVGIESPDDAAVVRVPDGMRSVLTVDYFRAFVDDPYDAPRP